jgi:glycine/D-amino acid oxidase-like deaminating enzyme
VTAPPPLRRGRSIWVHPDGRATRYPALRGRHQSDIAIIGAGMTGAMIAAVFAEAGVRVMVLEAARAGLGSTAASTALLLQEPDYSLAALSRLYSPARARRLWQLSHQTTAKFIALIKRFRVECDLKPRDSIYYTLDRHAALRRDCERRRRHGFRGELLETGAMHRLTGIDGATAIRTEGNARLDPVKACRGLLEAARRMGARIYERSEVRHIRRVGDGVRLYCSNATIDAAQVVIATGYATKYFRPLAGRFRMRRTYVLVTDRIGAGVRRRLGLDDVMLWDTERPYHYVRWTDDGRLLLGGEDRPAKPGATRGAQFAQAAQELREYFDRVLPPLQDVGISGAWEGLFAMTPDGLPYIGRHRRYPRHLFALGYGGNGMSFAALAARILLEQWNGVESRDQRLFAFNRAAAARAR